MPDIANGRERVNAFLKEKGIKKTTLAVAYGFKRQEVTKGQFRTPTRNCWLLNVSTDYLLGRTDNPAIANDDTVAGYTSDDLRKMAENAKTFDGKPLTEEDIDAIQNIIEIYLRGR